MSVEVFKAVYAGLRTGADTPLVALWFKLGPDGSPTEERFCFARKGKKTKLTYLRQGGGEGRLERHDRRPTEGTIPQDHRAVKTCRPHRPSHPVRHPRSLTCLPPCHTDA